MNGAVGADTRVLGRIVDELDRHAAAIRRTGWDVEDAVRALVRGSGEVVPALEDHAAGFDEIRDRLQQVVRLVDATAIAIARADDVLWRRWVPGHDRYGRFVGLGRLGRDVVDGGPQGRWWTDARGVQVLVGELVEGGVARGWWSRGRLAPRLGGAASALAARAGLLLGAVSDGSVVATGVRAQVAALGPQASRVVSRMSSATSAVRPALTVATDLLGAAGAGLAVGDAIVTALDDDASTEAKVLAGIEAVGSVAMLAPGAGQVVGAVLVGGVLVYEHREAIADAARASAEWVGGAAEEVADRAGELVDDGVELLGDGLEAAGELVDGARSLLDGLF